MAGVYIKDMVLPADCGCCDFAVFVSKNDYATCELAGRNIVKMGENGRRYDCPLLEVPDHGDLIDGNALSALFRSKVEGEVGLGPLMVNLAALCIDNAPVVIPGDKEEG